VKRELESLSKIISEREQQVRCLELDGEKMRTSNKLLEEKSRKEGDDYFRL
jgi:hypothetical protein